MVMMSFNCNLLHTGFISASIKKLFSFVSFFRRSFKASKAICCLAQKVAAAFWNASPSLPSNCNRIGDYVIFFVFYYLGHKKNI